ncbi:hypothetical protein D9Q98_001688 [Chlorella vulgaris]|uniref:Uncharacterized protein n=1 Tax=Chlorella vulgaris TaxID=3077 RepID=A0A9D4Z076_CHLVU|nr:hypothetical protein D9Q98_001688 [Chlorella vulgaris]
MKVGVRVGFHNVARESSTLQVLEVDVVPQDTVLGLKQKVAAAAGGAITADDLLLSFGPNDRHIGRQYVKDPAVDEGKLKLEQYSLLSWIQRFPHWTLSARLLPAAPPAPGVAIHKAAASAEQKDPDTAVMDARAKGEIPKISDLPAPWGTQPSPHIPDEELTRAGYLPPRFPGTFSPLTDVVA